MNTNALLARTASFGSAAQTYSSCPPAADVPPSPGLRGPGRGGTMAAAEKLPI